MQNVSVIKLFTLSVTMLSQDFKTRSSAEAEGPRDAPQIRNITLEKACNRGMTFKDTQDHSIR